MIDNEARDSNVGNEMFFSTQRVVNWNDVGFLDMPRWFVSYLSSPIVKRMADADNKFVGLQKTLGEERGAANEKYVNDSHAVLTDIDSTRKALENIRKDLGCLTKNDYTEPCDYDRVAMSHPSVRSKHGEDSYRLITKILEYCLGQGVADKIDISLLQVAYNDCVRARDQLFEHEGKCLLKWLPDLFNIINVFVSVFILAVGWALSFFLDSAMPVAWLVVAAIVAISSHHLFSCWIRSLRLRNYMAHYRDARERLGKMLQALAPKIELASSRALENLESKKSSKMKELEDNKRLVESKIESSLQEVTNAYQSALDDFKKNTFYRIASFQKALTIKKDAAGVVALGWTAAAWSGWKPAAEAPGAVRIGTVVTAEFSKTLRARFGDLEFDAEIPVCVGFPASLPLLVQTDSNQRASAISALQGMAARLLATMPPGRLRFTFVDPIGLGQQVSSFLPLGDYDDKLVTGRAWSEPEHIDKRLKELTEHLENVIQKYLRHEFLTIEDYNNQAHEVAESYRVLMVFDFPVNFTEASARRLVSLVQNGPRCGVFPIILHDTSKPLPYGFSIEDLLPSTERVVAKEGGWTLLGERARSEEMAVDAKGTNAGKAGIEVGDVCDGVISHFSEYGAKVAFASGGFGRAIASSLANISVP